MGQRDRGGLRRRRPPSPQRGQKRDSKFCTKAWSKPFQLPPCPKKGSLFHRSFGPVAGMPQPGPPPPIPSTDPPPPSPEPLRSYLHWKEQVRGWGGGESPTGFFLSS